MTDVNTSDHLPITACMPYEAYMVDHAADSLHQSTINWDKAEKEGLLEGYVHEVQQKLAPRMCRVYDGVDQLSQEMGEVAEILVETAERLPPGYNRRDVPSGKMTY